ncbi:HAD family phosphatase [Echinicola strongylocentroti]|uniref:HAD family phosphatase n=1 Tax=Echinicola strongylocentroti TaxID=1795355 RepID=A0A2Z4IJL9_9BACT|nr:HAD family phosphatase [Echinicola strongylocentroti]AWW30726.1 HAD family phosphatase [Echinicola strongylocentroti]
MENFAVIFDMDGVICHTNPFHSQAFDRFFEKRGMKASKEEYADHMYGKPNSYIFSYFLKREVTPEELVELENEKEGLFREIYSSQVTPVPGYMEFLASLKEQGFRTGVGTSAPRANMDLIIDTLGIRNNMESLMASEDVTTHKPEPEVYLKSADNLSTKPANCVVFEDSYSGVSAGINAGMKVVGVLTSHTKEELPPCDIYIKDYNEITVEKVQELLQ